MNIVNMNEDKWMTFIYDEQLFLQQIDTINKVKFWKKVINTSEDSIIINHPNNRKIFDILPYNTWKCFSDDYKSYYKDSLRKTFCLDTKQRIFATRGKLEFYNLSCVFPLIGEGIDVFIENGVDPWYAQSILLVESPNGSSKSRAGAVGYFQLMSSIAKKYGLIINGEVDERIDFYKAAKTSALLIKNICLPNACEMLNEKNIKYNEDELWFRLLTLHIYHAGTYNVKYALTNVDSSCIGMDIIKTLWETETHGFKNSSQNYSQVVLATLFKMNDMVQENCIIEHYSNI